MSPIVTTMAAPAGRARRVKGPTAGGGGGGGFEGPTGGSVIANFKASADHSDGSPTVGVNFSAVTKNGVTLSRDGTTQLWPCAHPVLQGPSYEGGAYVYRTNNNSGPGANELKFGFATPQTESFIEWWVYMPTGAESPSYGGRQATGSASPTANDKVFRLYNGTTGVEGTDYDFTNCTVKIGMSMRGTGTGSRQSVYIERQRTANVVSSAVAGTDFINIGEVSPQVRHEYGGADAYVGQWVRHRLRAKVASSANNDGIVQFWLGNTLVLSRTDLDIYAVNGGLGNNNSFKWGYIWGFRNSGVQDSRVYVDNLTFSSGGFI